MKRKILFVDDEVNVLDGLRRMLHPLRREWDMEFASNAGEALVAIEKQFRDAVVSDMRMPGMDGAWLLAEVKKRSPETVRIILSGQADKKAFLRSSLSAHRFLSKPCDCDALRLAIDRGCSLRDLVSSPAIRKLIMSMETVPSLPHWYGELIAALESPDASLEDVAEIVGKDIGMAAKILQLSNSAYFGHREPIADIAHATQILGLDAIQALALSLHVFSEFKKRRIDGVSVDDIWEHSLTVGEFARRIARAEKAEPEAVNRAFVAGLLHDVGILALAVNLPAEYEKVLDRAKAEKTGHWRAEAEAFGASHAEVGAYLMGLWGLPDDTVEAIAYHHRPSLCPERSLSPLAFVHVADVLEHEARGCAGRLSAPEPDTDYLKELGLLDRLNAWLNVCLTDGPA
ncbi:MAG: HDOD domain-containing protein [Nitrospinae bacterium]|nr:HDOD domain-containing protein [Nitrospinota bacterium]